MNMRTSERTWTRAAGLRALLSDTVLFGSLLAGAFGAAAQGAQDAAPQARSTPDERTRAAARAQEFEQGIAEAQLLLEVERDPAAALAQLEGLAASAADPAGFAGQAQVLASLAVTRAQLLAQLGRQPEARAALRAVLPANAQPQTDSPLALAAAGALLDPRVVALRAEWEETPAPQGADEDPVVHQVRRTLETGGAIFLREPTRAQLRAMQQLVRELRAGQSGPGVTALGLLLEHEPLETAAFLLEQLEGSGEYFQHVVLSALAKHEPLKKSGAWSPRSDASPVLLEPVWRDLIERLVEREDSLRAALPFLAAFARTDTLSPPLAAVLRDALFSERPDVVKEAFLAIADRPGNESVKPLYEALLEHPEPALRLSAARTLANWYEDMGRLIDLVDSEDTDVRAELARALGRTEIQGFDKSGERRSEPLRLVFPEERPAIVRLCADPDPQVRNLAVVAAQRRNVELPREILLPLAAAPAAEVVQSLVRLPVSDLPLLGEFLELLAPYPDAQVSRRIAARLGEHDWKAEPDVLMAALKAHLELGPAQDKDHWARQREALKGVWESPEAATKVARWVLEQEGTDLVPHVLEAMGKEAPENFAGLSRDEVVALVRRYTVTAARDLNMLERALSHAARVRPQSSLFLAVASLPELPLSFRLGYFRSAVGPEVGGADEDPLTLATLRRLLNDPSWFGASARNMQPIRDALDHLSRFAKVPAGTLLNRVLAEALADPSYDPDHLLLLVNQLHVPGKELARTILARWPVDGAPAQPVVERILLHGQELGLEPELLVRGLELYPNAVVTAMSSWRDPAFLEPLARALEPDWMPSVRDRGAVRELAARGLANLLSDDAARALLECAERTGDQKLRELCFEGLETIRTYQDARERWERRVTERQVRAQTVERLLGLLSERDPGLRSAALLALGELGEVRALPRIAELATDADPTVRAAALEALRRLRLAPEGDADPGPAPSAGD